MKIPIGCAMAAPYKHMGAVAVLVVKCSDGTWRQCSEGARIEVGTPIVYNTYTGFVEAGDISARVSAQRDPDGRTSRNHRERVARMEARIAEEAHVAPSALVEIARIIADAFGITDAVKRQRKIMRRRIRRWETR